VERRAVRGAAENDVYTGWRRMLCWTQRAGAVKSVKKSTHRRERRERQTEVETEYLSWLKSLEED
jgi:hypothetical protein